MPMYQLRKKTAMPMNLFKNKAAFAALLTSQVS